VGFWVGLGRRLLGRWREPPGADSGRWGEDQAERHLQRRGYRCLGKRVRVGRRGELDLIMRDGETLVFIEVKTRGDEEFGRPVAAVNARKRRAICRAAIGYLRLLGFPRRMFRFDVVEVIGTPEDGAPHEIRHLENVFPLDRRYRI